MAITLNHDGSSRREFLTGKFLPESIHLASVLVMAQPARMPSVEARLESLPGVETHGRTGPGKVVTTIETSSDAELVETMSKIESLDGVVSALMVFHHSEEADHGI